MADRERHNTTLGATEMAFGIENARKQMQDEITRDTLVIQLTELKPDWLQNRSVLLSWYLAIDSLCQIVCIDFGDGQVNKICVIFITFHNI